MRINGCSRQLSESECLVCPLSALIWIRLGQALEKHRTQEQGGDTGLVSRHQAERNRGRPEKPSGWDRFKPQEWWQPIGQVGWRKKNGPGGRVRLWHKIIQFLLKGVQDDLQGIFILLILFYFIVH